LIETTVLVSTAADKDDDDDDDESDYLLASFSLRPPALPFPSLPHRSDQMVVNTEWQKKKERKNERKHTRLQFLLFLQHLDE